MYLDCVPKGGVTGVGTPCVYSRQGAALRPSSPEHAGSLGVDPIDSDVWGGRCGSAGHGARLQDALGLPVIGVAQTAALTPAWSTVDSACQKPDLRERRYARLH